VKGKTQAEPEAGPEVAVQVVGAGVVVVVVVVQVRVVQTGLPRELHTQVLQSWRKVVPGVQTEEEGVVVVVTGARVVVVVTGARVVVVVAAEVVVGQVDEQKPYSPVT